MSPTRRLVAVATACLVLFPAASFASSHPVPQTSLPDVSDEVMCTVCGVLLDEAPDSPQAQRERDFIRREIAQGKTKGQIEDDLVAEYGPGVLAEPGTTGFDLAAWVVPGGAILFAAAGIGVGLRRWRRATETFAVADASPGEPPLDPEDERRLDSDLERFRL